MRGIRAVVGQLRDASRWRVEGGGGVSKRVVYRDGDGVERARYEVARPGLMEEVMKEEEEKDDENMMGLYALRRYDDGEPMTVYLGEDIGEYGGSGNEEMERRVVAGGGRHVMWQGARMIDGKYGPTGAQYINSAYRAPKGWVNNARNDSSDNDNTAGGGDTDGVR